MVAVSNLVKRPSVGAISTSPAVGLRNTTTAPTAEEKSDKIFKEVGIGTENSGDKKKKRLKGLRGGGGAEATLLGE